MTGPSPSPDPSGDGPINRRWFEDALRSQGFVVAPPADDLGPADPQPDDPRTEPQPAAPRPAQPGDASAGERPPMPSALLARIAARGTAAVVGTPPPDQAHAVPAGPTPDLVPAASTSTPSPEPVSPPTSAPHPEAVTPPERVAAAPVDALVVAPVDALVVATVDALVERPAPWMSAVDAPVAPWAPVAGQSTRGRPHPGGTEPPVVDAPVSQPQAPPPTPIDTPAPAPSSDVPRIDAPGAVMAPAIAALEPSPQVGVPEPSPAVAALASPYTAAGATMAATSTSTPPRSPVMAGPDASEGELWALVGASQHAVAPATTSDARREVLTILMAFLILAVVVVSVVLVSQIA
jgi:hypothetical protein